MNLVIVPGNSPTHREWAAKVKEELSPLFEQIFILNYAHWDSGEETINFDVELERLEKLTNKIDNYLVFAKSAGTLLSIRAVQENKIHPKKCILLGIPVDWARKRTIPFETWIIDFSLETLMIQQEFDRTGSAEDLETVLKDFHITNYSLQIIPGDDHDYSDWEDLRLRTSNFINTANK